MISSATEYDYATGLEFVRFDKLNQKIAAPFASHLKSDNGVTACFFFGVVNKLGHGLMQQKRIIMIGGTALYQCGSEAEINRCVPIREVSEVIIAADNWIGLRVPAQYDIMFQCLTTSDTRTVQKVLICLFRFQSGGASELAVRHTLNKDIKGMMQLSKPPAWVAPAVHPFKVISWDEIARRRNQSTSLAPTDDRVAHLEEQILEYEDRLLEEQELMEKLDEAATQFQRSAEESEALRAVLAKELSEVRHRLEVCEQVSTVMRSERDANTNDRMTFERKLADCGSEVRVLREQIAAMSKEGEGVRSEVRVAEEALRNERSTSASRQALIETLQATAAEQTLAAGQHATLQGEWATIRTALEAKLSRLESYEGVDLREIGDTATAMLAENDSYRAEIATLEAALRSSECRMFELSAELREFHTFRDQVEEREDSLHRREVKAATALRDAECILKQKELQLAAAEQRIHLLAGERELSTVLKRRLMDSDQKCKDMETLLQVSTKVWGETQAHFQSVISRQGMEMETLTLKLRDVERYIENSYGKKNL